MKLAIKQHNYFFLFLFIALFAFKRNNAQSISISGKIFDTQTKENLQFVYVLNKRTQDVVLTNITGIYSLTANSNDTLLISLLGYQKKLIYLKHYKDSIKNNTLNLNISLDYKLVDLKTFIVTTNEFSKQEKEYFERNIYTPEMKTLSPISALYNKFSAEAKEKEKVAAVYNERLREEKLVKRVPNELLRKITEDEKLDANDFRLFMKIPNHIIDSGSNYELYLEIKKWHTLYKMQRSGTSF